MVHSSILNITNPNPWMYLPEPNTISQYLNKNDLIELGKVSKKYRSQLITQILSDLFVPCIKDMTPIIASELYTSAELFKIIIACLERDLSGCYRLVKRVIFKHNFTIQFAKEFFTLFPNISHIKVKSHVRYSLSNLIKILHDSNYLKSINLKSICISHSNKPLKNSIIHNFFYQLSSIKIYDHHRSDLNLPYNVIDTSFSNLECLTITNNSTLNKLSNGLSSLRYVEFSNVCNFDKKQLRQFFTNNPQLNRIVILSRHLDEKVLNSILSLEMLRQLDLIEEQSRNEAELCTSIENYSIKHLKYRGYYYNKRTIGIISMCKILQVFEICGRKVIRGLKIASNENFPEINTLLITNLIDYLDISKLESKLKFKQVKFRDGPTFGDFFKKYKQSWGLCWKPKYNYENETDEFTLIRKTD